MLTSLIFPMTFRTIFFHLKKKKIIRLEISLSLYIILGELDSVFLPRKEAFRSIWWPLALGGRRVHAVNARVGNLQREIVLEGVGGCACLHKPPVVLLQTLPHLPRPRTPSSFKSEKSRNLKVLNCGAKKPMFLEHSPAFGILFSSASL